MKKCFASALVSTLAMLCFGASAFASQRQASDNGQKPNPSVQALSFDDIKVACQNPARYHNQVAPTDIQISCREVQRRWIPDVEGTFSMPTSRYLTTSVYSDKYTVNPRTDAVPLSPQISSCPQFIEVAETLETVRAVDCDEVVAFSGSAVDFCSAATTSLRSVNANAVASQPTGQTISLCGEVGDRGQRDQRGQRDPRGQH